ncbi:MAG: FAD-dependent oxidoreductase [Leptolyngbya foveolarum]|uniref:FAD-dependent oxidoreductase n=1 Tax=Leptolyngbya foveolarum TaxID=47253 RepID=A0A2W4U9E7_9CYAN|nr:MAG: FAD-dependent oxidoreductase [Leptolyngbya foveolarum]
MSSEIISAEVLVVGGGAGGTAAAIQAARRGVSVVLVSELPWLGGMLTAAGVSAPDGNELAAFQTGIWGEFLWELRQRHPSGLGNGWVSFFTYRPAVGAQIFADWVKALPNLRWIMGQTPQAVLRQGDYVAGVQFESVTVCATITIDGTELGDLLPLAEVPFRWGWETQAEWDEPSAPVSLSDPEDALYEITQRYPVQSPTWVMVMEDYGEQAAPMIPPPLQATPDETFGQAWASYLPETSDDPAAAQAAAGEVFLNYGRLPDDQFMINWPHCGNDYGVGLHRLVESAAARAEYGCEAQWHSQSFANYIQRRLGNSYGLAMNAFPFSKYSPGGGFAMMPYYRESRRVKGLVTVSERDILPMVETLGEARVAALPVNDCGDMSAIALGNYPNDHHYPGFEMPLAPKAIRWGGRWTGTAFTIPYEALVPESIDGLLVCEKNISVSHIANGATRLQPVVLGIGQAAGMAAALCVEQGRWPREFGQGGVRSLQTALINDPVAPAAVVPLFNLPPEHPDWAATQQYYLTYPEQYPRSGYHDFEATADTVVAEKVVAEERAIAEPTQAKSVQLDKSGGFKAETAKNTLLDNQISIIGKFSVDENSQYKLHQNLVENLPNYLLLVTVRSEITDVFLQLSNNSLIEVKGTWNSAGKWLLCMSVAVR